MSQNIWSEEDTGQKTGPEPAEEQHTSAQPPFSPPNRACLICGLKAWVWNEEIPGYQCQGNPEKHITYSNWVYDSFPRLRSPESTPQQ